MKTRKQEEQETGFGQIAGYVFFSLCLITGFLWIGHHAVVRPVISLFETHNRVESLDSTVTELSWRVRKLEEKGIEGATTTRKCTRLPSGVSLCQVSTPSKVPLNLEN